MTIIEDPAAAIADYVLLDAALRNNFLLFVERCFLTLNPGATFRPNWHIKAIEFQLSRIRRGDNNRLIINLPPRHLKSTIVSVAFPAFVLGHDPTQRIIVISYANELSFKHARDFRAIVESPWYRRVFPKMRIRRATDDEVTTTLKGFRKATSITGALTGIGGNMIIIDDPQKPLEAQSETLRKRAIDWLPNTLLSRLDDKEAGAIVLVTQRLHMQDLSGFLMTERTGWEVLSLPAIAETEAHIQIGDNEFRHRKVDEALHPAHESRETLRRLEQELGPDVFAAQYQQSPVPAGGNMIKREWIRYYEKPELPERTWRTKIVMSIDTAAKDGAQNDYSAITIFQVENGVYYLVDLVRGRFDYPLLRSTVIELAKRFKPDWVLIEDASTGIALAQELKSILRRPVKLVAIEHNKVIRLYVQQQKFAAGLVRFPKGAPFMVELERELLTFPQSKHDDQVDSISQALAHKLSTYTLENL
jgi:predicted phage terminase large subunit-like protein